MEAAPPPKDLQKAVEMYQKDIEKLNIEKHNVLQKNGELEKSIQQLKNNLNLKETVCYLLIIKFNIIIIGT